MPFRYFPIIQPWLEPKYQLIAQPPPGYDPGDTAQREGMFAFATHVLHKLGNMSYEEYQFCKNRYENVLGLLNDPNHPGFLRRYPDPAYWGGLSDRFSRDQATSNIVAMGYMNRYSLKKFFFRHLKYSALLFMDNIRKNWSSENSPKKMPDLTLMSFHGLYIRAFEAKILYPLLWITDLEILVNALIKVLYYSKDSSNNDDLSYLMCQYQAQLTMPTLWSWLAKKIYARRVYPANAGNATNPAQASMNAYFRGVTPGPKLEQVYQEITEHFN